MDPRCDNSRVRGRTSLEGCDMSDSTTSPEDPNPGGLCECGCGGVTSVFKKTCTAWNQFKGKHARYISGHHGRKSPVAYTVSETTGCWEWALGRNRQGYGVTGSDGRSRLAHRVYYERVHGPIPPGLVIDHLCRNHACVNPSHLEAVTQAENLRRGPRTKLTAPQVADIRLRHQKGSATQKQLADEYGVSTGAIHGITHRRNWAEL